MANADGAEYVERARGDRDVWCRLLPFNAPHLQLSSPFGFGFTHEAGSRLHHNPKFTFPLVTAPLLRGPFVWES